MEFTYSIEHLDLSSIRTKKDLIVFLNTHDKDSFDYSIRTAILNDAISFEMKKNENERYLLFQCGLFHDTGKLGMSAHFLNYPDHYTVSMFEEMQKHPSGGAEILSKLHFEREIIETARYHHSNFDGSGYPSGLYYDDIPFHARLTRISDSIDAYLSNRCYKSGGPVFGVLDDLYKYAGTSYDPEMLEAFQRVHTSILKECHLLGVDFPSQAFYMDMILMKYSKGTFQRFHQEILSSHGEYSR